MCRDKAKQVSLEKVGRSEAQQRGLLVCFCCCGYWVDLNGWQQLQVFSVALQIHISKHNVSYQLHTLLFLFSAGLHMQDINLATHTAAAGGRDRGGKRIDREYILIESSTGSLLPKIQILQVTVFSVADNRTWQIHSV